MRNRFRTDCNLRTAAENGQGKTIGIRILTMLTRLGQRSEAREHPDRLDDLDYDYDNDNDNDNEKGANGGS